MGFYTRWEKEYENFLELLNKDFDGEIIGNLNSVVKTTDLKTDALMQQYGISSKDLNDNIEGNNVLKVTYPSFNGFFKEFRFSVELNENSKIDNALRSGNDNCEYLHITFHTNRQEHLTISHKDFFSKILSKIKLNTELESGNLDFNKLYLIEYKDDISKKFVMNKVYQATIINLLLFKYFQVVDGKISVSYPITKKVLQKEFFINILIQLMSFIR